MDKRNIKNDQKQEGRKRSDVRTNWSVITGVQKLELAKLNNFPTVRRQLFDAIVAEFGDLADFLIGESVYYPATPDSTWRPERYRGTWSSSQSTGETSFQT